MIINPQQNYPIEQVINDSERGEWKIQILMQINCISTKDFEKLAP